MPRAERNIRVESIVLRHRDWGEADRLLVLYTRERGKLRAVAKGVRRLRSRKAGHLQPFTRVTLMLAAGRDLWIVTQAEAVDVYLPIREDLLLTGYAAYVVELLDRFTFEEGENRLLFQLLADTLKRIASEPEVETAVRYYELHLLDLLGFRPELFECVSCHAPILPENQFFSNLLGGAVCPKCQARVPDAYPVSMTALKFMRHYLRSSYAVARRAVAPPGPHSEIEALLQRYLTYLLERGLKTPSFLREIRGNTPPAATPPQKKKEK